MAHWELGHSEEAEAAFTAALAVDPNYALAHYGRGLVHLARKAREEAIHDLERALDLLAPESHQRKQVQAALQKARALPVR